MDSMNPLIFQAKKQKILHQHMEEVMVMVSK